MNKRIEYIKSKLDESISQVCNLSWMFCTNPGRDFTRNRKLPLRKVISFLLSAEGGTLTTEMLKHFGYHIRSLSKELVHFTSLTNKSEGLRHQYLLCC